MELTDAIWAERCRCPVACREHHEHAVRTEPARTEQQRIRGRGIEPVRILDHAQHGALLGGCGQHRQRRDRHQERLDRGAVLLPERDPQCPGLRAWEVLTQPHHREQHPVQGCERQRRLDLEPLGSQDQRLTCICDERFEQGRLAHTRFTVNYQTGRRSMPGLR